MSRDWRKSYTVRMIGGMFLIHSVLIPMFFIANSNIAKSGYVDQFVNQIRSSSYHLSLSVSDLGQEGNLQDTLDDSLIFGEVVFAVYTNSLGQVTSAADNVESAFKEDFEFNANGDQTYFTSVSVVDESRIQSGVLMLGFDESLTLDRIQVHFENTLLTATAYFMFSLLLLVFFGFRLSKPIAKLGNVAHQITAGGYEGGFLLKSGVLEIDELAASLELMWMTLQKRNEELKHGEERKQLILDNSLDAFISINVNGIIEVWNQQAEVIFGWTAREVLGLPLAEVVIPESVQEAHLNGIRNYISTGQGAIINKRVEFQGLRKDGSLVPIEIAVMPVKLGEELSFSTFIRDLTHQKSVEKEQKHLQDQLLHVQKLESLGILAGGIAHDFNNLLTGILGNADLARAYISDHSPARKNLEEVSVISLKAAELCKQMLAYSGKGKFIIEKTDLSHQVFELGHMLDVSIPKKIVVDYKLTETALPVEVDVAQLQQVVMNLITNAAEAIGEQVGRVIIRTGLKYCRQAELMTPYLEEVPEEGEYGFFEVTDDGCGMDEETMLRLFDPFFTTKFTGRGLGMSAILGIVKSHGGSIQVESKPGLGSTFIVFFPLTGAAEISKDEVRQLTRHWQGKGLVLLADDESTIRTMGTDMLTYLGFLPVVASNGREAVELFRDQTEDVVCAILDLTMPMLDGEECLRELRDLDPNLPIVISSGNAEDQVYQKFSDLERIWIVPKPYRLSLMSQTMQEIYELDRD